MRKILAISLLLLFLVKPVIAQESQNIVIAEINGAITPATDLYLESSINEAVNTKAKALVVKLNTPGGLLPSMQSMVSKILESPVPVIVYVGPAGAEAKSAGVFIAMAAHVAVMAPGTTIGAAHPVTGTGDDIQGDMRIKIENSAASLIKAISEQRGRNAEWAELAVRESVAITDREAVEKNVIDFTAQDIERVLAKAEGKVVTVKGQPVSLAGISSANKIASKMSLKEQVLSVLADPNITILLALGALLGIGLEFYHPGGLLPGTLGAICLVLSLVSAQVVPVNVGGVILLILGAALFAAEMFTPSFGLFGTAGGFCLVLGAIYFVDTENVWGTGGFSINYSLVVSIAVCCSALLMLVSHLALKTARSQVVTGQEGLVNKIATVSSDFDNGVGKVEVFGEIWNAELATGNIVQPKKGDKLIVESKASSLKVIVKPSEN